MKKLLCLICMVLIAACSSQGPSLTGDSGCKTLKVFFDEVLEPYQDKVDQVAKNYQDEQWKVETHAPNASPEKVSKLFAKLQEIAYDRSVLEKVRSKERESSELSGNECPLRNSIVRVKQMLEGQILTDDKVMELEKRNQDSQDALANKSNGLRIKVTGEKDPVSIAIYRKLLGSTANRGKREALYKENNSQRAIKWIEWGFRDLVKARNEEARAAGYANYYDYRFFRNQLDLKNYRELVGELKAKLSPKIKKQIAKLGRQFKIGKVEDWDLRFMREQAASGEVNNYLKDLKENQVLEIARDFYHSLGIEIEDYHFTMDLLPRDGKNTHAFAMSVMMPRVDASLNRLPEPKMDIRFLANLKIPVKWDDVSTVIHELGHAIHAAEVKQPLGIFRGLGSVDTEAIAMTLERMANSQEFLTYVLEKYGKVKGRKIVNMLKKKAEAQKVEQAFVLLRQVFFSDFEYEFYKNPDVDFSALWAKMHADYWGIEVNPQTAGWDVDHYVMSPVYVQHYAIGITMVEQFYDSIQKEFKTSYRSKELGNKLKNKFFRYGMEFDYLGLTKGFTGKPLSVDAALQLL